MQDISEIYDQLTDKDQADLLEALAGKRNGQAVASVLNNSSLVISTIAVPNAIVSSSVLFASAIALEDLVKNSTMLLQLKKL